jgi:hypothetical protein
MRACTVHGGAVWREIAGGHGGGLLAGRQGRLLAGYEEHGAALEARRMAAAAAAAAATLLENRHTGYNLSGGMLCCHYLGGIGWILGVLLYLVRVLCVRACGGLLSPLLGSQPVSVRCRARAPAQV